MSEIASLQKLITLLPGVLGVKVTTDVDDKIIEIHILANAERHPKQIVRDVKSVAMAQLGMDLDHRLISIAQIESDHSGDDARLALDMVQLRSKGDSFEANVELILNEQRYSGRAKGLATTRHRLKVLAEATVSAVQEYLGERKRLYVEDVSSVQLLTGRAIITVVAIIDGQVEQLVAGCAYIRRDEADAAIRATLSAINRRIHHLNEEYSMTDKLIG